MDLETFKARVENWRDAWPKLTQQALKVGTNIVRDEIKRRWSGPVLKQDSGQLVRAVQSKVTLNPLGAKVEVAQRQQYKAQTHEEGKTIDAATGRKGQLRTSRTGKAAFLQLGPPSAAFYGRPKTVTIPARPVFHQAKQDKIKEVLSIIEKTVVEGWQKA
jgi:phage gpG-like protein